MPIYTSDGQEYSDEYEHARMELYNQGKEMLRQEYLNSILDPQSDEVGPFYTKYNDQPTPQAQARYINSNSNMRPYSELKDIEMGIQEKQVYPPRDENAEALKDFEVQPQEISDIGPSSKPPQALGELELVPRFRPNYSDPGYIRASEIYNQAYSNWNSLHPEQPISTTEGWRAFHQEHGRLPDPPKVPIKMGESGYYSVVEKGTGHSAGKAEITVYAPREASSYRDASPGKIHINMIRAYEFDSELQPGQKRTVDVYGYNKAREQLSETARQSNNMNQAWGRRGVVSLMRQTAEIWPGYQVEGGRISGATVLNKRSWEQGGTEQKVTPRATGSLSSIPLNTAIDREVNTRRGFLPPLE